MSKKDEFIDVILKDIINLSEKGKKVNMKNQQQFSQTITDTYVRKST
jgi:hypothetical protein